MEKENKKEETQKSVFDTLFAVDCSAYIEKKNGLSYVSWANAWAEAKKRYPNARYNIYEDGRGAPYHTDGRTCWVKTGVVIEDMEYLDYLPIMDFRNYSIPLEKVTSMDVNKAIQRSLTKALARHGLGLYVYAGEDLPEEVREQRAEEMKAARLKQALTAVAKATSKDELTAIWRLYPDLHEGEFKEAVKNRGIEVSQPQTVEQ